MKEINHTMMQYFEWYLPNDCRLWKNIATQGPTLKKMGITSVWLPPAQKGAGGTSDTGYGAYDLYDLGEFNQKGTVRTKYGTKEEYLAAIKALQKSGIKVLADIVLNHRLGADEKQDVIACKVDPENRLKSTSEYKMISAWTKFNFEGRNNKYSDFKMNWSHFNAIDYDCNTNENQIFRFYGKHFSRDVDQEKGNYDYLMGADVDFNNLDTVDELHAWGKWFY
jgi:alpha-amylase